MIKKFAEKNLIKKSIKYATRSQIKNECWHVEGIIKNRSNETLRFDIRKMDTTYKKKPAKPKSKFQKKLEEMQRTQEQRMRNRK